MYVYRCPQPPRPPQPTKYIMYIHIIYIYICTFKAEHEDPQQSVCNVKIVNKLTFRRADADAVRKVSTL